jgi:large subunit ribosomal protein L17
MKHRKTGRQFGRNRAQRKALQRTMLGSLVMHERMQTTEAKAKELKSAIDRMITRAKRAQITKNPRLEIVRKLEGDMPLVAIKKLSATLMKRFDKRSSGYTRVIKMSPRKSDGARMAMIEFVDQAKKAKAEKKDSPTKAK